MKISKSKNKEIHALIIGDEILSGKREDKHLRHLIKVLKAHNFQLSRADYVSDEIQKYKKLLKIKRETLFLFWRDWGNTR
jgi:molybdopterin-biosynthesis enzyme MoeA-like protein